MMKKFAAVAGHCPDDGRRCRPSAQQQPAQAGCRGAAAAAPVAGEDRYIGYYYPKPTSTETFESTMQTIAGAERAAAHPVRHRGVAGHHPVGLSRALRRVRQGRKGAIRMIIVGMQQGELNTIYRMRALLANMTTMSRLSPFFQERTVAEDATFFDLLKLLGFRELTITDGEKATLQVTIK